MQWHIFATVSEKILNKTKTFIYCYQPELTPAVSSKWCDYNSSLKLSRKFVWKLNWKKILSNNVINLSDFTVNKNNTMPSKLFPVFIASLFILFLFVNYQSEYANKSSDFLKDYMSHKQLPVIKPIITNQINDAKVRKPNELVNIMKNKNRIRKDLESGFKFKTRLLLVKIVTTNLEPFETANQIVNNIAHIKEGEWVPDNVKRFWMLSNIMDNKLQSQIWDKVSKDLEWTEMVGNPFQRARSKVSQKINLNVIWLLKRNFFKVPSWIH